MTAPVTGTSGAGADPGPATVAAPPARRVLSQAWFEAMTMLRNGEQLLVAIVLPALMLLALSRGVIPGIEGPQALELSMAGVFGLAVISTAFTGQAISTGFDRRYGVLRLLGTTPLGRGGLLGAKALAVLVVLAVQLVVLGALGMVLGWQPHPGRLLLAVPLLVVGAWVFVALALLLAGTVRAEAVLAVANLLWVLVLGAGGIVVPPEVLGPWAATVVPVLPFGALGEALRSVMVTGAVPAVPVIVLVAWGVVFAFLASRFFRWSD